MLKPKLRFYISSRKYARYPVGPIKNSDVKEKFSHIFGVVMINFILKNRNYLLGPKNIKTS